MATNYSDKTSDKAVFIFAIVMIFVTFLGALISVEPGGHPSMIPSIIWGYQLWLIRKKNYAGLVSLNKIILWIAIAAAIIILFFQTNDDAISYGLGLGRLIEVVISAAIHFWMYRHFKQKQTSITS